MAYWIKIHTHTHTHTIKQGYSSVCCLQETHFRAKDTETKSKGLRKIFHKNRNAKNARINIHVKQNRL